MTHNAVTISSATKALVCILGCPTASSPRQNAFLTRLVVKTKSAIKDHAYSRPTRTAFARSPTTARLGGDAIKVSARDPLLPQWFAEAKPAELVRFASEAPAQTQALSSLSDTTGDYLSGQYLPQFLFSNII